MIRISPSLLEAYRLYSDPENEWFTTEKLETQIVEDFTPNMDVARGIAFHKLVEHWDQYRGQGVVNINGFNLDSESCLEPVSDLLTASTAFECYGRRNLETFHGPVSIATKADAIQGNVLFELKTTGKSFTYQKYADSVQWKLCAWTLGMRRVEYRVQQLRTDKNTGIVSVVKADAFPLYFNDSHMAEVISLIEGLINFHLVRKLDYWLLPYEDRKDKPVPEIKAEILNRGTN